MRHQSYETMQFRVPANPRYVSMLRKSIHLLAGSMGFPEQIAGDIELSVAEALANAVKHGSPQEKEGMVVVTCRIGEDKLTIDVRDEGPGFDALRMEEYDALAEGGRGLRLIYELMDKVKIARTPRGARICMMKSKPPSLKNEAVTISR